MFHPQWLSIRAQVMGSRYAAQHASGVLVDIGCGQAPFRHIFGARVSAYFGIDCPDTASILGGSRADILGVAQALPFRSASVDTILLTEVLEHLPEPLHVLRELQRILKPHGVLILTAPLFYNVHGAPYDFFRYTPDGLRVVLEQSGFRVVELRPQGYFGTTLGLLVNNFITIRLESHRLLRLIRWTMLLPILPLVFAGINVVGWLLDRLSREARFSFNHLVIARTASG